MHQSGCVSIKHYEKDKTKNMQLAGFGSKAIVCRLLLQKLDFMQVQHFWLEFFFRAGAIRFICIPAGSLSACPTFYKSEINQQVQIGQSDPFTVTSHTTICLIVSLIDDHSLNKLSHQGWKNNFLILPFFIHSLAKLLQRTFPQQMLFTYAKTQFTQKKGRINA